MIGCAKCGTLNRKGSKYCSYCGERLTEAQAVCASCGRPNAPDSAYCIYCSAPLQSGPAARDELEELAEPPAEEPQGQQAMKKVQLPAWLYTTPEAEPAPALAPAPASTQPANEAEPGRTRYLAEIEGVLPSAESWLALSEKRVSDPDGSTQPVPEEPPQRARATRRSGCLILLLAILLALIGLIATR